MTDPNDIKSWAEAASATFTAVKSAIGLLPSGKKREEAERLLADAEREQKKAEAALAQKLGFELCEYCWPPEIVLISPESQRSECRHCHRPPARIEREKKRIELWRSKHPRR
jgi:hypothetical protein